MPCSLSHTCQLQVPATAQHRCPRDMVPAVPRALLLGLREERPAFKDLRELNRGERRALSSGRAAGPCTSQTHSVRRRGWGQGPSGSYAETWVPKPAPCTWRAEHGPKEAKAPGEAEAPGEADAHSPTAHLVGRTQARPPGSTPCSATHYLPVCLQAAYLTSVPLCPRQSKQQPQPPQRWQGLNGNKVLSTQ